MVSQKKTFLIYQEIQTSKRFFIFQGTEFSYIAVNRNPKKISSCSGSNFLSSKNKSLYEKTSYILRN